MTHFRDFFFKNYPPSFNGHFTCEGPFLNTYCEYMGRLKSFIMTRETVWGTCQVPLVNTCLIATHSLYGRNLPQGD